MIEIDPQAEYTPAQVASLLNMAESQVRGLWQQWPVCGFDVLGYCHRHGIPHTMRPILPESKIGRALRVAQVRSENRTEQELFPMRDHYRRMLAEERERFAELVRSLATATEAFFVSDIYVRVHYIFEQYDEEGNCVYSEGAEASPKAIQQVMPFWAETADIQP